MWGYVFVVLFLQRQKLNQEFDDSSDSNDEQPQIVIVKSGDLSAEQVEAEKRRIESGKAFSVLLFWSFFIYVLHWSVDCLIRS